MLEICSIEDILDVSLLEIEDSIEQEWHELFVIDVQFVISLRYKKT